jgi:hypothetical protein
LFALLASSHSASHAKVPATADDVFALWAASRSNSAGYSE